MPFCQNCGSEVAGRFCATCGAATGVSESADPVQSPGPPPPAATVPDNVVNALCYVPLVYLPPVCAILALFIPPYSENKAIRFHAFQGLLLFGVLFVLRTILVTWLFPFSFVGRIFELAWWAVWIFMIYKAYNNEMVELPGIGTLARRKA